MIIIKMMVIAIVVDALETVPNDQGEGPRDIAANVKDWVLEIREFELQSRYYVYFQTNTFRKSRNTLISPSFGLDSINITAVLLWGWL